jgi:hypothetical protein
MGSGANVVVYNARERVLTPDFNRMQRFAGSALSQVLMRLQGQVPYGHASVMPGVKMDPTTSTVATYPVRHRVLGGLMVRPDAPGYLIVDAGSAAFYAPAFSTNADDSDWVLIDDPGVTLTTDLVFTANAGAGIRIDVVECQPSEDVLEQESRDIYNTSTEVFDPTLVNKRIAGRLTYRIRLGTPGAGIPNNVADWCPLAIVMTTVAATGFTTCELYDVRALMDPAVLAPETGEAPDDAELDADQGFGSSVDLRTNVRALYTNTATASAVGWFQSNYRGYRVGGPLFKTTPDASWTGTDVEYVSLFEATNQSADQPMVLTGDARNSLVCILPTHFYRFVKYSRTTTAHTTVAGRFPIGPNGIYCFTTKFAYYDGNLLHGIQPPASTGITQACYGPVVGELYTSSTGTPLGFLAQGRRVTMFQSGYAAGETLAATPQQSSTTIVSGTDVTWTFLFLKLSTTAPFSNGCVPMDATAIIAKVFFYIQLTGASTCKVSTTIKVGSNPLAAGNPRNAAYPEGLCDAFDALPNPVSGDSVQQTFYIRIPLMPVDNTYAHLYSKIFYDSPTVTGASSYARLTILGYDR